MKKYIFGFLFLFISLPVFSNDGDSFNFEGIKYTIISEKDKTVKTAEGGNYRDDYPGNRVEGDLILPPYVNYNGEKYTLVEIGYNGFCLNMHLYGVSLPGTIKKISQGAFYNCYAITNITIPDSVEEIGDKAFADIYCLEKIDLGSGLQSIGRNAFSGARYLESVVIPNSVKYIGKGAFLNCEVLSSIKFNAENCSSNLFDFYRSDQGIFSPTVTSVSIGEKVQVLPAGIFLNLELITTCHLPGSIGRIEEGAFSNCKSLKEINLPDNLTSIESYTFSGCSSIRSLEIPSSVTRIGRSAFRGSGCETLKLPENLKSFEDYAFADMKNLSSIEIPQQISLIPEGAFSGTSSLKSIQFPPSVETIRTNAFSGSGLESLLLPPGLKNIYWNAFEYCENLQSLTFLASDNEVKASAFAHCKDLQLISLPNYMTALGRYSFFACDNLKSIVIPNSVERILFAAFDGDYLLEEVVIGYGLSNVEDMSFENPSKIFITAKTPPSLETNTFNKYIADVFVLPESVGDYESDPVWSRFNNINPLVVATSMTVDKTEIMGCEGEEFMLTASLLPEEATLHNVFWTSSNPDIALVYPNGLVKIGSVPGECTIKAESIYPDIPPVYISVNGLGVDSVESIFDDNSDQPFDIYTIQGIRIRHNALDEDIDSLSPGLYIVKGKKILVR